MPRKTDGIPFEVHRSPSTDKDGGTVLYASPLSNRIRNFDEVEGFLEMKSALRQGELQRAFETFLKECSCWLSDGYRVQTPLGSFTLKLGMKRKVTNTRDVHHDDVEFKGIEFRPSAEFINETKRRIGGVGFRYVRKADSTLLMGNEEEMRKALHRSMDSKGGYTTVSRFMSCSSLSKYAATKKLSHWCAGQSPLLKSRRLGHSIIYEFVEP